MMPSIALRNVCNPLFSGSCSDFLWRSNSVSQSAAYVLVVDNGWIVGDGIVSKLWWLQ